VVIVRILTESGTQRLQAAGIVSILELGSSRLEKLVEINFLDGRIQLNMYGGQIDCLLQAFTKPDLIAGGRKTAQHFPGLETDNVHPFVIPGGFVMECCFGKIHKVGGALKVLAFALAQYDLASLIVILRLSIHEKLLTVTTGWLCFFEEIFRP
jgi:hypothetical protein